MAGAERITLNEDLTIYHAAGHLQQLVEALAHNDAVEVDLSHSAEIDTAGLQVLIVGKREASRLGKKFRIVAHSPEVRRAIDFCNLTAFFGDPVIISARESV